jgi:photosystem II stability/assembly factor-like uncharacterized protein
VPHPRPSSLPLLVLAALAPAAGRAQRPAAPAASSGAATAAGVPDTVLLGHLRWRFIGPARGGRVTAVTGVPSEPYTFYLGATGGGVWKTTDAGTTWHNVSDGHLTEGSIGAVEVAPSDANVVWVGTGSDGLRSNVSTGRGVYRSTDAGRTWTHVGLALAGQIGAIRVDPRDPSTAYVAALGNAFAPNRERGVYKTADGGRTWARVLHLSDSTGAVDVELEPGNPDVVYASMWRAERKPWTIVSGAREGGIYRSADAGRTWAKLGGGLPTGLFGKSNVAVSAANPARVYALVEAKPGSGLYRSDDRGATWRLVNAQATLVTRPFYYTTLAADPTDADVVYAGAEGFFKSTDGGATFRPFETPHGDNHDLWINPRDARLMVQANDGGANVSLNGGRTWSTQYNQPTARSTRSPRTTRCRTASTARSRTRAARSSSRRAPRRPRRSTTPSRAGAPGPDARRARCSPTPPTPTRSTARARGCSAARRCAPGRSGSTGWARSRSTGSRTARCASASSAWRRWRRARTTRRCSTTARSTCTARATAARRGR